MKQVCIDKNTYYKLHYLANLNNFRTNFNFLKLSNLPKEIIFIRHGEKKSKNDDGNLSKTGEIHSKCWVDFFRNNRPSTIGLPNSLYAMKMGNKKDSSNRPYETILPLSKALNLPINNNFSREEYSSVIHDILNNNAGKNVLVCWEHKTIVNLVNEIIAQLKHIKFLNSCDLKVKNWGNNIIGGLDEGDNFSSLWKIIFNGNSMQLFVYPGCSVDKTSSNCKFFENENKNPRLFSC